MRRAASGSAARDLLERDWDILFQVGRSTFRPRDGTYDPVQQLLVDIRPGDRPVSAERTAGDVDLRP